MNGTIQEARRCLSARVACGWGLLADTACDIESMAGDSCFAVHLTGPRLQSRSMGIVLKIGHALLAGRALMGKLLSLLKIRYPSRASCARCSKWAVQMSILIKVPRPSPAVAPWQWFPIMLRGTIHFSPKHQLSISCACRRIGS